LKKRKKKDSNSTDWRSTLLSRLSWV